MFHHYGNLKKFFEDTIDIDTAMHPDPEKREYLIRSSFDPSLVKLLKTKNSIESKIENEFHKVQKEFKLKDGDVTLKKVRNKKMGYFFEVHGKTRQDKIAKSSDYIVLPGKFE